MLRAGKDFHLYPSTTGAPQADVACQRLGTINDAAAYEGTAVVYAGLCAASRVQERHADACAEWKMPARDGAAVAAEGFTGCRTTAIEAWTVPRGIAYKRSDHGRSAGGSCLRVGCNCRWSAGVRCVGGGDKRGYQSGGCFGQRQEPTSPFRPKGRGCPYGRTGA